MNRVQPPRFEKLAALARQETVPPIDVRERVRERLMACTPEPSADWVLVAAAVFSVAAAVLVMALANQQGVLFSDTLAELIRPFTPVIQ